MTGNVSSVTTCKGNDDAGLAAITMYFTDVPHGATLLRAPRIGPRTRNPSTIPAFMATAKKNDSPVTIVANRGGGINHSNDKDDDDQRQQRSNPRISAIHVNRDVCIISLPFSILSSKTLYKENE